MLKQLFAHTSNYTIGSFLVTLASLISFPILTRVFTVHEYGMLNLISATLLLLVGFAKFGIQHSVPRFYGEMRAGKRALDPAQYYSTVFFGMAGAGLAVTLLWSGVSQMIPAAWWNDVRVSTLLLLTSVLIFIRVVDSGLVNLLRAEERSGIYSLYSVVKKYAGLVVILLVLFTISRDLYGFYIATIATEIVAIGVLGAWMLRTGLYRVAAFSTGTFRAMLGFGLPMVGYEVFGIVLSVGDRYIIQGMLGGEPLGIYAAAYNLCEYIQGIFIVSISQAIVPMYVRLWEQHGEPETQNFLRRSLHYYLMFGLPIIAGLSAVGPELLTFLASEKYREGAMIIPYVISGMIMSGAMVILGAGLYIHKQTKKIMVIVLLSALLNLAMNFVLVPAYGIEGAGIATFLSYVIMVAMALAASAKQMYVQIPWGMAAKFSALSFAMYVLIVQIHFVSEWLTLWVKMTAGITIYAAFVLMFDTEARRVMTLGWNKYVKCPS